MHNVWKVAAASCATLLCTVAGSAATSPARSVRTADTVAGTPPPEHWAVLDKYCSESHNTTDWAGGIAFDTLSADDLAGDAQTWEKAIRKLETGMMPPPGKP